MTNPAYRPIAAGHINRIGVIGGGTIGASWSAYFLARGFMVTVVDPLVGEVNLRSAIDEMWPMLLQMGVNDQSDPGRLTLRREFDDSWEDVDFVQECGPENLDLKRTLLRKLETLIDPHVIIASSTSSLLATDIQAGCRHPERVLVGHPFNPPHLLPLVEVVAGEATAPDAVDWAMAFYAWIGKAPVHVKKEVVGHIANRLTAALFREAIHIVAEGIGTVADVDEVMTKGPGLRWAFMGPHLTYHLGGGSGGIEHYMAHLGPTQEARWRTLGDPKLTDELKERIVEDVLEMVGDRTIEELARQRDEQLVQLQTLLGEGS